MRSKGSPRCAKWRRCRGTRRRPCTPGRGSRPIESLALQADEFAQMEYDFLFDRARQLLTIGYNVTEHRADQSYYDLLASEARLCSFVAIAQGHVPQDNWFAMGRLLVTAGGEPMLLSWSGSMFEYLMPLVVMPTYENTLLDQTYKAAVARQIEYGTQRGVPWGVSESGYNAVDAQLNYQYRAFGVPGTGLKRGLADDLVIAPYASALALMVAPEEACINLERLSSEGFEGTYGLYEAIDYTPSRVPRGQLYVVVRSFMAHHQGMSLLSFAHLLLDRPMQKRFASRPVVPGDHAAAAGARAAGHGHLFAPGGGFRSARRHRRRGNAGARHPPPGYAVARTAALVERPVPRDDHQRRRRVQPLERSGGDALARRRHLRQLGHLLLYPRAALGRVLVGGVSTDITAIGQL